MMGEVHPLFSAWLICRSLMKGMTLDECLGYDSKDESASFETSEDQDDEDWGSSTKEQGAGEIEKEVFDWGNGEIVISPTMHPCDNLAFDGEINVRH